MKEVSAGLFSIPISSPVQPFHFPCVATPTYCDLWAWAHVCLVFRVPEAVAVAAFHPVCPFMGQACCWWFSDALRSSAIQQGCPPAQTAVCSSPAFIPSHHQNMHCNQNLGWCSVHNAVAQSLRMTSILNPLKLSCTHCLCVDELKKKNKKMWALSGPGGKGMWRQQEASWQPSLLPGSTFLLNIPIKRGSLIILRFSLSMWAF